MDDTEGWQERVKEQLDYDGINTVSLFKCFQLNNLIFSKLPFVYLLKITCFSHFYRLAFSISKPTHVILSTTISGCQNQSQITIF